MTRFKEIKTEQFAHIIENLALSGEVHLVEGEKVDALTALNHDLAAIESLIERPLFEIRLNQKSFEAQEIYNQTLVQAKERWRQGHKKFKLGASILKDLAAKKRNYEACLEQEKTYQEQQSAVRKLGRKAEWQTLTNHAHECDEEAPQGRVEKLNQIAKAWHEQGPLASFFNSDLLMLTEIIFTTKDYIQELSDKLQPLEKSDQKNMLLDLLEYNRDKLRILESQAIAALSWRLRGMGLFRNLHHNDAFATLKKLLASTVFVDDDRKKLKGLEWIDVINQKVKDNLSYDAFIKMRHLLLKYAPSELEQFDEDVERHEQDNILDADLNDDSDIAYLMNDAHHQLDVLNRFIEIAVNHNRALNLMYLSHDPGFNAALSLPKYIALERERIAAVKPSPMLTRLVGWVPKFNFNDQADKLTRQEAGLQRAEEKIQEKCNLIVEHILKILTLHIQESIDSKSFQLPDDLFKNIEYFIKQYGTKAQFRDYIKATNPIAIKRQFAFLVPDEANNLPQINEDSVHAFLHFARKYWKDENLEFVETIVDMLLRHRFPTKVKQRERFSEVLAVIQGGQSKINVDKYLGHIATKYIFPAGDKGDDGALAFLIKYAPNAAKVWQQKRKESLKEKLGFMRYVFLAKPEEEYDLNRSDPHEMFSSQFYFVHCSRYIQDIMASSSKSSRDTLFASVHDYLQRYRGMNVQYLSLFVTLNACGQKQFLESYLLKRIECFIDMANHNENINLSIAECEQLSCFMKNSDGKAKVIALVRERFEADKENISELLNLWNDEEINAAIDEMALLALLRERKFRDISDYNCSEKSMQAALARFLAEMSAGKQAYQYDPAFVALIETYAALSTKERFRLLQINKLISTNDINLTKRYLQDMQRFIPEGTIEDTLVYSIQAKQALVKLFQLCLDEQKGQLWRGHLQYFMQFFLPKSHKQMLHDYRIKWLRDYMAHPEEFVMTSKTLTDELDFRFHEENIAIPSEDASMTQYFGAKNLDKVYELIDGYIGRIGPSRDDGVIGMIGRYLCASDMQLHVKYIGVERRFKFFSNAQKISFMIARDHLQQASAMMAKMAQEMDLLPIKDASKLFKVYMQQLLGQLMDMMFDRYKHAAISLDGVVSKSRIAEVASCVTACNPSERSYDEFKALQKTVLYYQPDIIKLYQNLDFNLMHHLYFEELMLMSLAQCLSVENKNMLKAKIRALIICFKPKDPINAMLEALIRVIDDEYATYDDKQKDIVDIKGFQLTQPLCPKVAQASAKQLITEIRSTRSLSQLPMFNPDGYSFQVAFVRLLSQEMKEEILVEIDKKIAETLRADPVDYGQWHHYSKLYTWFVEGKKPINNKVTQTILERARAQLKILPKEITKIKNTFDNLMKLISKPLYSDEVAQQYVDDMHDMESALLTKFYYIRLFGLKAEKRQLDKMIDSLARRQRRTMINGYHGRDVNLSLALLSRVIMMTGNEQQQERCQHLVMTWQNFNIRRSSFTPVIEAVLNNSISEFTEDFDTSIYQYFVTKFNLGQDFVGYMVDKIAEFGQKDDLIDGPTFVKAHPPADFYQILIDYYNKQKHGFFDSKPQLRDGLKLMVAFCLSTKAHQLVTIFHKQNEKRDKSLPFNPESITSGLTYMVKYLATTFDIGGGEFNESLRNALNQKEEHFASWATEHEHVEEVKLKKVAGQRM